MKKSRYLVLSAVAVLTLAFASVNLASMLGISTVAAKKVIDIIDTASTVATIISLIGVIVGVGGITAGLVTTAKAMIKKYGKKYATMW
ncbi:uberolysin/carnocyclin family circular bacteriocin [Garciella nitratireducens]|uniref:Circular bacteriocin, circularin A/uberolysin family n=1 Tax=Garciella nitratireducens DSM 15102 TaxID=1121911 RepID=A0A1T4N7U6_9FIRM|nr:uberolysin/carnocyclin family circular bacteriocin [Garciella nitratireducens]RBP35551.1 circularin A/uberolysin family circular bacteriocin [Garciella nitratireducens]SJZ75127.1 circular bacteriocin, circularin A/uberolysin family [Garciella nitratireducens DSM 15102]